MKYILLSILSLFVFIVGVNSQDINKPNVKTITIYETDYEEGSQKPILDKVIKYDRQGNVIEEKNFKNGKFDEHLAYKYDQFGNKTEEKEFDEKGKVKKITQYKYENNLRTERIVLNGNGKIKSKKTYEYEMY